LIQLRNVPTLSYIIHHIFRFWICCFHYSYFCKTTCKYKHDADAVNDHGSQGLKSNFIHSTISTTDAVIIGAPVVKSMINTTLVLKFFINL